MKKNKYIAHPGQSLEEHLIGVGHKAKDFSSKINLADYGELIGLLHDLGKYSKKFQDYIGSATGQINPDEDEWVDAGILKGKIDHSTAGAQWVWKELKNYGNSGIGQLCGQILALCIASHHSGLIDCLKPDGENGFLIRMKKTDEKTNLEESIKNADEDSNILNKAHQLAEQGLAAMRDQIKSILLPKNEYSQKINIFNLGLLTRFLFSCLIDADRIDSADSENPEFAAIRRTKPVLWKIAIDRFEKQLFCIQSNSPIDSIRRKISDDCYSKALNDQGIYTLTVPTGGGKTYASLRYALKHAQVHHLDRIIYIIPYTSIIEQNAEAIRQMIEDKSDDFPWVLEHHSNLEPEQQTWHSKISSENWDSPIVLTTMVQFLETLFGGGTRGARRMHQLARSVLVFDEIQTLPINCTHMFCNALNFLVAHTNTTAILCTATQPLLNELKSPENGQLSIPEENELIENVSQLFDDLKRVDIINQCKAGGWQAAEIAELALSEFNQKGSCLIIVNTKEWAKNLYQLCQTKVPLDSIFHLSTNQYPLHRKKILYAIRQRLEGNLPVICISTQLIEAGVDLDFASVIRFVAGLDSIAQAAGRCNRHGKLAKATVHVLNPDHERIDMLKNIKVGQEKTLRVFSELQEGDLLSPEKIKRYFKYYFFDRADDMDYPVTAKQAARDDSLLGLLSMNKLNPSYSSSGNNKLPMLLQSFMTAGKIFETIDAPTHAVIVQHGEGKHIVAELCAVAKEFDVKTYHDLLKKAQQYSVNVFPNVWKKLQDENALYEIQNEGIFYLDERYYSDDFGLSTEPVTFFSSHIC